MPTETRKRRPGRRRQILESAARLFHEHGYHATGMDEIGAAAGITGPGIYRHFDSKADILEQLVRPTIERMLEQAHAIAETAETPRDALEGLTSNFIESLLANRAVASLVQRERRHLDPEIRAWVDEAELRHVDEWVAALRRLRPELPEPHAQAMIHAALWLCLSVAYYDSGLGRAEEAALMRKMATACLLRSDA